MSCVDSSDTPHLDIDAELGSMSVGIESDKGIPKGTESVEVLPKPSVKKSEVWDHYDTITLSNGIKKNQCRYCENHMAHFIGGTTTHLKRHLKDHCKFKHLIYPDAKESDAKSKKIQAQLSLNSGNESSIATFKFDFERVKTLASHMILAHEYPFRIVEHKVFIEFLKAYTPHYRPISRYMVRKKCFEVYETEKQRIISLLARVNRVGLTTDCWWSNAQKIGYMVITCHFIDENWKLQKRILSFVNVPPPHNGAALAKEVHRVSNHFGITDKVASITVDNASANDSCIAILKRDYDLLSNLPLDGKLFHVRCCAHIINLLVNDGTKEIQTVITKVRDGVKYLFGSENRMSMFNEHRLNLKLPSNKLVLDNNTRWNSTYVMLSTAYRYRQCFSKYVEDDETFEQFCPSTLEWEEVFEVCEFLEVFLDVTNLVCGTNYPTVNLFLLELSRIKELLNYQLDFASKKHMYNMASRMAEKFDKYWSECDLLLSFGSILDPRYKKVMIHFAYQSMYPIDYENRIKTVENLFDELFNQYLKIFGDAKGKGPEEYSSYLKQPPSTTVGKRKFDEFLEKTITKGKEKTELELYYDEPCYTNVANFDALAWWKGNSAKYRVLSKMAMDILSIPITSVASESAFSTGGRVIDKRRASMRKDTVEVLLCVGDWVKVMYGIRSSLEGNDDPIELENFAEFDMKDGHDHETVPDSIVHGTSQTPEVVAIHSTQKTTATSGSRLKKPQPKKRKT